VQNIRSKVVNFTVHTDFPLTALVTEGEKKFSIKKLFFLKKKFRAKKTFRSMCQVEIGLLDDW